MKLIIACITIFILGYYPLSAQSNADYFPYEKNNYWEYDWVEFGYPDTIVSLSVFDTIDAEGRKIAIFDSYFINPIAPPAMLPDSGTFIIDSSLNVFSNWAPIGYDEYALVYKLNGNQGNQWVIYDYSQIGGQGYEVARIKEIYDDVILGVPTRVMRIDYYFVEDSTDTTGILERGSDYLAKGFGLQGRFSAEFASIYLKGAVINGILYGDTTNIIVGIDEPYQSNQPERFELFQNYPNPFNPSTSIQYTVGSRQFVTLKVYYFLGNEVATLVNEEKSVGSYRVEFDATGLPSGTYFYRITTGNFGETKKMLLIN